MAAAFSSHASGLEKSKPAAAASCSSADGKYAWDMVGVGGRFRGVLMVVIYSFIYCLHIHTVSLLKTVLVL